MSCRLFIQLCWYLKNRVPRGSSTNSSVAGKPLSYMTRTSMEQSDLDLLRTVPGYHLQAVIKARRVPVSLRMQAGERTTSTSSSSDSSDNILEIAQHLLAPSDR